ncbi:hydantoinase/oxoprolinase family protein [Granulicella sp. WH15]|uniref:hydantoinase/oxoprolinase family protein n=1 Tax=Granulicella sp. WH15 TaxID=2602070 RepID=UPI0013673B90|nr:hydantoinase/oxoprolinase family protein [Granulicella sp. WH15]QHN02526.1 hydantoinase/oxoprolinase family protein [Granulicella sp. WH15]
MRVAIDSGGTFTDCVFLRDGRLEVLKLFSTPADPGQAVLNAARQAAGPEQIELRHGTTVGTNAMLERKGARVALVTTAGFEDVIAIGRQARASLYDWFDTPPPCVVEQPLRFGIDERVTAEGAILRTPTEAQLAALREAIAASGAESIALSLLFSFANPANERLIAEALAPLGLPISVSHRILPEFREYERTATVVVNAYLAPKVGSYLNALEAALPEGGVSVMQSSGGIVPASLAAREPVRTVLSGPAGGVIGAWHIARQAGIPRIIGFDMGGTSTDVALISDAGPTTTSESIVSGLPVAVPMLNIHTVGAGGGSLARFDAGGILRVGPESAGSVPGPICYGRGSLPTVTDANLVLGRLDPDLFLGGAVRLDEPRTRELMGAARGSLGSVERFASGILTLSETAMEKAIRVISIESGYDPREFPLVSFGGAGPLHACSLARALRIPRVLVPCMPGALSALGILIADVVRDYSRTVMLPPSSDLLATHYAELETQGEQELLAEGLQGTSVRSADVRYVGQGYELNVPAGETMLEEFHRAHERRYGYANRELPVEVVNLRVRLTAKSDAIELPRRAARPGNGVQAKIKTRPIWFEGEWRESIVYDRDRLHPGDVFSGPALITEYSSTTVLPPRCVATVDELGNLLIEVNQ